MYTRGLSVLSATWLANRCAEAEKTTPIVFLVLPGRAHSEVPGGRGAWDHCEQNSSKLIENIPSGILPVAYPVAYSLFPVAYSVAYPVAYLIWLEM